MSNANIKKLILSDRARHDSYFSERSPQNTYDYFPPESLLTRSNMINSDKSRQLNFFLSKSSKKDISYIYDSLSPRGTNLSPLLPSSIYPLPSEITELQLLLNSDDYSIDNIFKRAKYSKPYGRTDAINLSTWLEDMHNKYLSKLDYIMQSKDFVDKDLMDIIESIYLVALKESIKQISVYCIERAVMLHRIFEILNYTWKKTPDDFLRKVNLLNNKYNEDLKNFKSKYKAKHEALFKSYKELEEKHEKMKKENELLRNSQGILSQRLKQVKEDNEIRKIDGHLQVRKTKIMVEVSTQTEEVKFSDKLNESSSSDSSQGMIAETERIFTRQQTMANEKRGEHLIHLKKHIDLAKCSGEFIIEDLYQYITSEYLDFYAWVDGFRLAAEILNTKEKSVELPQKVESVSEEPQTEEKGPDLKVEEKKKLREAPRTIQFKPGMTIAKYLSENAPVDIIIEQIECLSLRKIEKISKMALKKLSNSIQFYLNMARGKPPEHIPSFSIFVYSLLFQKYSMQQPIVNRKFKELVASCIIFANEPKVKLFLMMIGAGKNLKFSKFFPTTNKMCLKVYEFMYNDKTGIVLENVNQIENNNFPLARAFECIRQLFEPIYLRYELVKLKKHIETMVIQDPDNVNRSGVIDIHQFVLAAVQSYQDFSERINQGVKSAVDILSGYNYLTWEEANVLIRNINPKSALTESDKNQITMSQTCEIEIEDFFLFCLSKGLLRIDDYHRFFSRRPPSAAEIIEKIKEVKEVLEEVLLKAEDHYVTLSFDEWDGKLDDIVVEVKSNKQDHGSKLWVLFWSEYQKLSNIPN